MKSLSPALQAHLDEGTTTLAWCWRITRADGVTFGFTDHDRTLSFDGTDFE
ncbi:baseplate hub domain-containing protein, partial [Roseisalinus antarcticus]